MIKINLEYVGDLRVEALHEPSGTRLITDAPVDNQGKGESFSPTDLLATGLASCMATIIGIQAKKNDLKVEGLKISVKKEMTPTPPRKICKLSIDLECPSGIPPDKQNLLEQAALTCPAYLSLNPEIQIVTNFKWK